jgi:hypothetical protein
MIKENSLPPIENKPLLALFYNRLGVLLGLAAAVVGGAIGSIAGKLSHRFTPAVGFVWGTLATGTYLGAVSALSIKRAAPHLYSKDTTSPIPLLPEAATVLETSGKYVDAVQSARDKQAKSDVSLFDR